jgi:c-di-GMP-binding flagellar brake protein YcgR
MEADSNKLNRNRRKDPRYTVDEAGSLQLVHQGSTIDCRIIDLSLGGCQVRAEGQFLAGPMVRVEVLLRVLGETLRIAGVTQWTRQKQWIGIRFLDVTERKRAALLQLIREIEELQPRPLDAAKAQENSATRP